MVKIPQAATTCIYRIEKLLHQLHPSFIKQYIQNNCNDMHNKIILLILTQEINPSRYINKTNIHNNY